MTIYCICRKGDGGRWMIGCDGCDEWFHGDCVNISKRDEDLIDAFYCPNCPQETTWKRKCRLPACRQPGDKYCSKEHGIAFFRRIMNDSLLSRGEVKAMMTSFDEYKTYGHTIKEHVIIPDQKVCGYPGSEGPCTMLSKKCKHAGWAQIMHDLSVNTSEPAVYTHQPDDPPSQTDCMQQP